MKSRVSKLVSMVCVVSMLISALPVSALAADEEHTHDAVNAEVYSIGGDTQLKGETGPMKAPALNAAATVADAAANPDYVHNFDTQGGTINGILPVSWVSSPATRSTVCPIHITALRSPRA